MRAKDDEIKPIHKTTCCRRVMREASDLALINRSAETLNKEIQEVLDFQVVSSELTETNQP